MQRIKPLHPDLLEVLRTPQDCRSRMDVRSGEAKHVFYVSTPVRMRIPFVFDRVDTRYNKIQHTGLAQSEQAENSLRLRTNAKLCLIVEWTLNGAGVEVKAHHLKVHARRST